MVIIGFSEKNIFDKIKPETKNYDYETYDLIIRKSQNSKGEYGSGMGRENVRNVTASFEHISSIYKQLVRSTQAEFE